MTILRLCPQCGALGPKAGLCPDCKQADNRRRNQKRRDSGRTTHAWQRLRLAALHRDGYLCQDCGKPGDRRSLTVHLDPALEGEHWRASLDDLTFAHLGGAMVRGSMVRGAILRGADLRGADLTYADLRGAGLDGADLRGAILAGASLEGASLVRTEGLDLGRFITRLPPERQKAFLDSQKAFLDSLSREELAKFKLSSEKLAKLRKEASGA